MGKQENIVESYLDKRVTELGGLTRKIRGRRGLPDRVCKIPGVEMFFAETKSKNGALSKLQELEIARYRAVGIKVIVPHSREAVDSELAVLMQIGGV